MLIKGILGLIFALVCIACEPVNRYFGLEDENVIEESSEFLIKYQTGMDIDLTPSTPE